MTCLVTTGCGSLSNQNTRARGSGRIYDIKVHIKFSEGKRFVWLYPVNFEYLIN